MPGIDQSRVLELFERDRAALMLYARNWVDESRASDVVQQVFVKLFVLAESPRDVRAWVFRSVRNAAISMLREQNRRKHRERQVSISKSLFEEAPAATVDRETVAEVLAAIGEAEREVVILRVWGEMTLEEVASVTGMSVASVHRMYRGTLAVIKAAMEAKWQANWK